MAATLGERTGRVSEFDTERGLGEVVGADGQRYPFHCTAVADGSREIAVDTQVSFVVAAGPGGRWEAAQIQPSG